MLFVLTMLGVSACTAHPSKNMMPHKPGQHTSQDITFSQGKLIEVVYTTPISSMQESLNRDYFPVAKPLAGEYGAKILRKFKVIDNVDGEIQPEMIFIFEWPDTSSKKSFDSDPRYKKIKPIRDEAFSRLRFAFYEVSKDITVTFQEQKVYEFFGAWLNENGQGDLDKYFKLSASIKKNYGRPEPIFKTFLSPVKDSPSVSHSYVPHMAGIVEWDKSGDFSELIDNKEFKDNATPLFNKAIRRIDLIHTKIVLN